jgi:hypothetical protein
MSSNFDLIFDSYEKNIHLLGNLPDQSVRAPWIFSELWDLNSWRPRTSQTVLVTGSKGKGTVARNLAWNLSKHGSVGLVVSPEELTHYDRIRIDNEPIDKLSFERLLRLIYAENDRLLAQTEGKRYLSPTGWFLTIALAWFYEKNVDWVIVEGGRGVMFDEIGQLQAKLGIVTSVYCEHINQISPDLEGIFKDKVSLGKQVQKLIVGEQVQFLASKYELKLPNNTKVAHVKKSEAKSDEPFWMYENENITLEAMRYLVTDCVFSWRGSPSFIKTKLNNCDILIDAIIHHASIDSELAKKMGQRKTGVIIGLPDNKGVDEIICKLNKFGLTDLAAYDLRSPIGHIKTSWFLRFTNILNLGIIDIIKPNVSNLEKQLAEYSVSYECLYIIGTQTFIRSIRLALKIDLKGF